ncbi:MAG: SMC-Scp complex subunit ScpB [Acidimicrobiales bacterium]
MVATEPVPSRLLAEVTEVAPATIEAVCADLADQYRHDRRGFSLVRVAGGWRYVSHPDQAAYVERFVLDGERSRLSPAALETLAVVAYRQPVSRAQIAAIRGVNADAVIRTLTIRGYVAEVGRDPGPGQAVLFGTTPAFLEGLGLDSVADLPALADFMPGMEVVDALEKGFGASRPSGGVSRPEGPLPPQPGAPGSPGDTNEPVHNDGFRTP